MYSDGDVMRSNNDTISQQKIGAYQDVIFDLLPEAGRHPS